MTEIIDPRSEPYSGETVLALLDPQVKENIFGLNWKQLKEGQLLEQVDAAIIELTKESQRSQADIAWALYFIKMTGGFKTLGYTTWGEYCKALSTRSCAPFDSSRQADRYIAGVDRFCVQLKYPPSVVVKYGPSFLGELAQRQKHLADGSSEPLVKNRKQAEVWFNLVENQGVTKARAAIVEETSGEVLPLIPPGLISAEEHEAELEDSDTVSETEPIDVEAEPEFDDGPPAVKIEVVRRPNKTPRYEIRVYSGDTLLHRLTAPRVEYLPIEEKVSSDYKRARHTSEVAEDVAAIMKG